MRKSENKDAKTERETRLAPIEMGLQAFGKQFLDGDTASPLANLWTAARECPELNLTRGNPNTWVAAIAYAFARMNFLFDDNGPMHIERADFFDFFGASNKSTVSQKATRIEKALGFYYGHPVFCLPEVIDSMPRLVQLSNGMVVPESILKNEFDDGPEIVIDFLDEKESAELERQLAEQERALEEEKIRQRHEKLKMKREEERKTQLELFDFED